MMILFEHHGKDPSVKSWWCNPFWLGNLLHSPPFQVQSQLWPPTGQVFVVALPVMGKVARSKRIHALPSKTHSCSELQSGHEKLLAIKHEHPDPAELQREIEEQCAYIVCWFFYLPRQVVQIYPEKLSVRSMKLSWQPWRSKKKTRPQILSMVKCFSNQKCISRIARYK